MLAPYRTYGGPLGKSSILQRGKARLISAENVAHCAFLGIRGNKDRELLENVQLREVVDVYVCKRRSGEIERPKFPRLAKSPNPEPSRPD